MAGLIPNAPKQGADYTFPGQFQWTTLLQWITAVIMIFLGSLGVQPIPSEAPCADISVNSFFWRHTANVEGTNRCYMVYVPEGYNNNQSWPLIVFLHGLAESGNDPSRLADIGLGPAIRKAPNNFPCLVAMPQLPFGTDWEKGPEHITEVLADMRSRYNVDPDRIYLTGISVGGDNTWRYAANNPGVFAALLPVAAIPDVNLAEKLTDLPIWALNGGLDVIGLPFITQAMVDRINAAGGQARFTPVGLIGHEAWIEIYDDPEVIAWLLSQRRQTQEVDTENE